MVQKELFDTLFSYLPETSKSIFLYELLLRQPENQLEFIRHFNTTYEEIRISKETKTDMDGLLQKIRMKANDLKVGLEKLDFEETDWDNYHNTGHYVPEYEIAQSLAEDEADDFFEPYLHELNTIILTGNLTDLIVEASSLFTGALMAHINDPYENLGDPFDYFLSKTDDKIASHKDVLALRNYTVIDFDQAVELAFWVHKKYHSENEAYLQFITSVFTRVIKNKSQAQNIWERSQSMDIELFKVPAFTAQILKMTGDETMLIQNLEKSFLLELQTSLELMDYYHRTNLEKFENTARRLFETFKAEVSAYLLQKAEKGTAFYIQLLQFDIRSKGNDKSFETLRKYCTQDELETFFTTVDDKNTLARIYARAEMYDRLLKLIQDHAFKTFILWSEINFDEAIQLLMKPMPTEALSLIIRMIDFRFKSDRNRDTYNYIAGLLSKAKNLPGAADVVQEKIMELYSHKPNLPALKDEFRKARLI